MKTIQLSERELSIIFSLMAPPYCAEDIRSDEFNELRNKVFYALRDAQGDEPVSNRDELPEDVSTVLAEAYQVVGVMAEALGVFDDTAVQKVMDNLSQQKLIHREVLPFSLPAAKQMLGVMAESAWKAGRSAAMLQGADDSLTHEGKNHSEDKLGMVNHLGDANEKGNSPVIPDGWKLVPIDPTKDMLRAGQSVVGFWLNTVHCYSKMLAAAPAAPQQEVK